MSALAAGLLALALIGAAIVLVFARLRHPRADSAKFSRDEFAEFDDLAEAQRCDLVFAYAALDGTRAHRLLERALADPSETVALAAARALTGSDGAERLEGFLATHPGERSARIAANLELLS